MKNKKDLTLQIQRINNAHRGHRLYSRAIRLAVLYNHNMSETAENTSLWQKYMKCHYYPSGKIRPGMEGKAAHYLELMNTIRYPRKVYCGHRNKRTDGFTPHNIREDE